MTRIRILFVILIVVLLGGCVRGESTAAAPTLETAPATVPPAETPVMELPTQTPEPVPPAEPAAGIRYDFDLSIDYYSHFVDVVQKIEYVNQTGDTLSDIALLVYPALFPGSFALDSMEINGQPYQAYRLDNKRLTLALPRALAPFEAITIQLKYRLNLPAREGTYGWTARQTNLGNWHPFIPAYLPGSGWVEHDPWVVNEFLVGEFLVYPSADYRVAVRMADGQESVLLAAPAVEQVVEGARIYQLSAARTFTLSLSDQYQMSELVANGVTIRSYYFAEHAYGGAEVVNLAARSLDVFSKRFGAYPRASLTVVEADFLHGMEFDGLFYLSRGFYGFYDGGAQNNLTIITAHETAHQWFFILLHNDQALEPWLDEALCTYSEIIYYETYHPELVDWWWNNRVNFFDPSGAININIYEADGYEEYRDTVYLNGAKFLAELRSAIGDDAFFRLLTVYVEQNRGKIATRDTFFTLLDAVTDVDNSGLVGKYFK